MVDKKFVAQVLKEFADQFDSLAEFARGLQMENPQQLYPYFNAKSLPGFELLVKLRRLGLDPNRLMDFEGKPSSITMLKEKKLEYDSEQMRKEVEKDVDRLVKTTQLWRPPIKPALARELRQVLRMWMIKQYRAEREEPQKESKKGAKAR